MKPANWNRLLATLRRPTLATAAIPIVILTGTDGVTGFRRLRTEPSTASIAAVALTAFVMKDDC